MAILTSEYYSVDERSGKDLKKKEPEQQDYYDQILTIIRAAKMENTL